MILILTWTLAVGTALYLYFKRRYSKFKSAGINETEPWILFGNLAGTAFRTENMTTSIMRTYNAFPKDRFVGYWEFVNPLLLIKDVDLLKQITVKDFDNFVDHRSFVNKDIDPLFGRNLVSLLGDEWRDMRSTLSPAFTSSKIKLMVPFMVEVGDQLINSLKKNIKDSGVSSIEIEIKDVMSRFANDVIATCAFGLKTDSFAEPKNEFYIQGKEAFSFKFITTLKFFILMSFPNFKKIMNLEMFPEKSRTFFSHLVTSVMKEREEKNIMRPDMIQLLMEAKKGSLSHDANPSEDAGFATVEESNVGQKKNTREWADIDLVAQATLFFLAGFDTVSTAMTFLLFEMAANPDIQDRLVEEIKDNERKTGGKFDYKSIQEMVYLDMVVSESLRKWPPAIFTDRLCAKDYNVGKPNDNATSDYIVKKGDVIWISMYAIHRDPNIYPNPEKYDPERFSIENRKNIHPFTYMPFGLGPRNCIGSRFALCEIKVCIYQLLKQLKISPSSKTCLPIQLAPKSVQPTIKGGSWLKMELRN